MPVVSHVCLACDRVYKQEHRLIQHIHMAHRPQEDTGWQQKESALDGGAVIYNKLFPDCANLDLFYQNESQFIINLIKYNLLIKKLLRVKILPWGRFVKIDDQGDEVDVKRLPIQAKFQTVDLTDDLEEVIGSFHAEHQERVLDWQDPETPGSEWLLTNIELCHVEILKCQPLKGSGGDFRAKKRASRKKPTAGEQAQLFIEQQLKKEHLTDPCFEEGLCFLAAAVQPLIRSARHEDLDKDVKFITRDFIQASISTETVSRSRNMQVKKIRHFEASCGLNLALNVFFMDISEGKMLYPIYRTKNKTGTESNLLLVNYTDDESQISQGHYFFIENLDRLASQICTTAKEKLCNYQSRICRNCLTSFSSQEVLDVS